MAIAEAGEALEEMGIAPDVLLVEWSNSFCDYYVLQDVFKDRLVFDLLPHEENPRYFTTTDSTSDGMEDLSLLLLLSKRQLRAASNEFLRGNLMQRRNFDPKIQF